MSNMIMVHYWCQLSYWLRMGIPPKNVCLEGFHKSSKIEHRWTYLIHCLQHNHMKCVCVTLHNSPAIRDTRVRWISWVNRLLKNVNSLMMVSLVFQFCRGIFHTILWSHLVKYIFSEVGFETTPYKTDLPKRYAIVYNTTTYLERN